MMFASTLFPQTEKPPFEDVQKTFNVFQKPAFTSPVRGLWYPITYLCDLFLIGDQRLLFSGFS